MRSFFRSLKGKESGSDEQEKGDTCFPTRLRSSACQQGKPCLSQIVEETQYQPAKEEPVNPSQRHPRHPNSVARRQQSESTQDKDRRHQAIEETLARRERNRNSNDIRGQELAIPFEERPLLNWQKIPYEFRCRDTAITKPGTSPTTTFWFAETDTIYVPASRGGPADIPVTREGMRYIIPIEEDKIPFLNLGKFWEGRRKALEELRMTGRLANRDRDRWGRPWSEHHAGLGKEQRKYKYGKQDDITLFDLGCGGERKITKPWWEYKMSMLVADALIRD